MMNRKTKCAKQCSRQMLNFVIQLTLFDPLSSRSPTTLDYRKIANLFVRKED